MPAMAQRAGLLTCLLLALGGCHFHRTIEVRVVDIETRKPIPGALVETRYQQFFDFFPPRGGQYEADVDGVAKVRVARNWQDRAFLRCTVTGYAAAEYLTAEGSQIEPGLPPEIDIYARRGNTEPYPAKLVIEKWRLPEVKVIVVVPKNHRGPIEVGWEPRKLIELQPGERTVTLFVRDGVATPLPLTRPIMASYLPHTWTYRFDDGTEIPDQISPARQRRLDDSAVAVRRIEAVAIPTDLLDAADPSNWPAHVPPIRARVWIGASSDVRPATPRSPDEPFAPIPPPPAFIPSD